MNIVDLIQGSPEWLAHRAKHFNASDAPAMMGCSPYKSRAELLREMHTGVAAEVDIAQQKRFDNGHRVEALARPLAEEFIGEDLYPVVGSLGTLSASFDGLTLDERQGFEHKALNAELRAAFADMGKGYSAGEPDLIDCRLLPIYHRVQMEQQLMVSGAERILFMASEWDAEGNLIEEQHCWYYADPALRQQIVDGWAQFERDLAAYVLPEAAPAAPVGKAPETLPALRIEVTGAVTASNLAEFKATALGAIRSVNRNLQTDQHFADAEKAVKWCADVESRLKAAKEHALSQTATIDALFKALDDIGAEARTVRLDLEKLVTRRKTEVKEQAVARACKAFDEHVAALNAEIAPYRLPAIAADFAGTIKGLKSVASMQDKLDALLATTKIAADAEARAIRENLNTYRIEADTFEFLFADLAQLVHKPRDDFRNLLQARIATERQRRADEEQRQREAEATEAKRRETLAAEQASIKSAGNILGALPGLVKDGAMDPAQAQRIGGLVSNLAADAAVGAAKAMADEPATLKLGAICERLGFTMTAQFVSETLGVWPKAEGASKLFTERQFLAICERLVTRIRTVQAEATVAA